MQRKNFLFCGPSLETRHETVEFPFELLPPSRRHNKSEAAADEAETGKGKEESEEETSEEHRSLVYISMGTLYRMNPLFFQTCFAAFKNSPHLFVMSVGKGNLGTYLVVLHVPLRHHSCVALWLHRECRRRPAGQLHRQGIRATATDSRSSQRVHLARRNGRYQRGHGLQCTCARLRMWPYNHDTLSAARAAHLFFSRVIRCPWCFSPRQSSSR
jgi:hypothetical protein